MTTPVQLSSHPPEPRRQPPGLTVKASADLARVQVTCPHQSGLIYAVPGDRSWVCADELRPAHALAGFFRELIALQDPRVAALMQQWGLYYRSLPLGADADASPDADANPDAGNGAGTTGG